MSKNPQISIIMPVYNGERFVAKAVESVLKQSFTDYELLIIDDGSTDGSMEVVKGYNDSRIRLISNECNLGLVTSRNIGVCQSKGEYVAFLDCDDIALRHRLKVQHDFLVNNPAYALVGSWIVLIDDNGVVTGEFSRYEEPANAIPSILLFDNYFAQSAIMAKREILASELYRSEYPCAEDYDLFSRITSYAKTWNIPEVLTLYRDHAGGISKKRRDLITDCTKKVYSWQLNSLGVSPSLEELEVHASIGCIASTTQELDLSRIKEWLLKLYAANNLSKKYDAQAFSGLILEKMALSCFAKRKTVTNLLVYYFPLIGVALPEKIKILLKIVKRNISKKIFKRKVLCGGVNAFA